MGFSRKRADRHGRPRYTACYLDVAQRERSAGTFTTRRYADRAWQQFETSAAAGRANDPQRGRRPSPSTSRSRGTRITFSSPAPGRAISTSSPSICCRPSGRCG